MKHPHLSTSKRQTSGFGLFEVLITLMTAGILVMLVVNVYGAVGPEATAVVDRRNAKIIIATHRQAVMAGALFSADTRDAIIRELIHGVRPGGIFRDRIFRVSGLDPDALSRAARFLAIEDGGTLEFDPQASQPAM